MLALRPTSLGDLMLSIRARAAARLALAMAVVGVTAVAVPPASADSVLVVPRTPEGWGYGAKGLDASAVTDRWTFTITAMKGKPADIAINIVSESPTQTVYRFASAHPRVGQTFTTQREVPAGVYDLYATISGGPVRADDSVTVSVRTSS